MKHSYLILTILSLFYLVGIAQEKVSYTYDSAGNRISRKIVLIQLKEKTKAVPPIEDELGERKVTVYPNPTKGDLAVEVTGGDLKDEIRMLLYSVKGALLQNKSGAVGKTIIDMSAYPTGWYILRIIAGNKATEFKIIKE